MTRFLRTGRHAGTTASDTPVFSAPRGLHRGRGSYTGWASLAQIKPPVQLGADFTRPRRTPLAVVPATPSYTRPYTRKDAAA